MKCQGKRRSWDGRTRDTGSCSSGVGESAPSPGGGPGGKSFFPFLGCCATGSPASGTQTFRAVSYVSGSQGGEDGSAWDTVSTLPSPSPFASGQQGPVQGRDAFSRAPCPSVEPGKCRTAHSDPTSERTAFRVGPLCSTSLPHCGYVCGFPGPACTVSGGLASAPQAVSLAHENHQTWLRDSVRPAFSQVQGRSVHLCVEQRCPSLACRSRGPAGEGRDRAGPSSRDEVRVLQPVLHRTQERRWVTTNLGPARSEPGPSQAPVQDVDAETHLSMHPSVRLVRSGRPEGRVLSCLDPPSTQTISLLCVRRASISVQGPPLRAPQPVGASGQLGKEQTLPWADNLFSRYGVGLGQPHSTSLNRTCSVDAELPGVFPAQDGSTETVSEAPGAYGIRSRCHAARIASYETASALASRPGPEIGMAMRHVPGLSHPVLPSDLQPWSDLAFLRAGVPLVQVSRHVVVSTNASAMGWGAMCNGHAAAGLWTGPRLQWHVNCLELLAVCLLCAASKRCYTTSMYWSVRTTLRPLRTSPGRSMLPSHVATRPPSPPLESEASEVLRAVHVPGELNRAADKLSRQPALPGEWRLHPEVVQLIWRRFGDAQVDLFASPDTSHCHLFYSLSEGTLGTDALAHSWPRGLRKYSFPPVSLLAQTLCKVREDEEQVLLVAPYWPNRTWFPEPVLLATAPPWQIPLKRDLLSQRGGTLWHPRPDLWNLHVWSLDGTRRF